MSIVRKMTHALGRAFVVAVCMTFVLGTTVAAPPAEARSVTYDLNIPSQDLDAALQQLALASKHKLLYRSDLVAGKRSAALKGSFTTEEALTAVLAGTGLTFEITPSAVVLVRERETDKAGGSLKESGAPPVAPHSSQGSSAEVGGRDWRLAQVDQGRASSDSSVEKQDEQASKKKPIQLEEVVVTGSRIPLTANQGAQELKVYSREEIERSGQTTVSDFLNTLPEVSLARTEAGGQWGGTTVQLHGLPIGSTLVLINGRRIEVSGSEGNTGAFFDLNAIPVAAIERIEVVSEGSSAVYGSDAIAGVVNIILKKDFSGFEGNAKYGSASGIDEWNTSLAFGKKWGRGSLSVVGSFLTRGELEGTERSITANSDHTQLGGPDARQAFACNPGNVFTTDGSPLPGGPPGSTASFAAVSPNATGNPRQTGFQGSYGVLNKCSLNSFSSLIPKTHREGIFVSGHFDVMPSVQLFTELMYSHLHEALGQYPPALLGFSFFQEFTASSQNPYNPFGETVGIGDLLTDAGRQSQVLDTEFYRPLVGARGSLFDWYWEIAAWDAQDRDTVTFNNLPNALAIQNSLNSTDPATALNPFVAGAQVSPSLVRSLIVDYRFRYGGQTLAANAFIRGPVIQLPSGPLELVLGSEYDRDKLSFDEPASAVLGIPASNTSYHRNWYALFGEVRVPIIANRRNPRAGDVLVATAAVRHDDYRDFGRKTVPQFGAEFRPSDSILIRSTYSKAFKAPNLYDLYSPQTSSPATVADPLNNNQIEPITLVSGGNLHLKPLTGQSHTFGFVYSSNAVPNLRLSVTNWKLDENNNIQVLGLSTLVANESLFPGNVIRGPAGPNGQPGPITSIIDTNVNFGQLNVAGFDYQASYRIQTRYGEWSPSLLATNTYHYTFAFAPGAPATDATSKANDNLTWAPRWKGTIALGWKLGPYSIAADGRYVGHYKDYDAGANGTYLQLGDSWLFDANFQFAVGNAFGLANQWLKNSYLEVGGVNIFNRLPPFSNFESGTFGYDPAQSDIRGRFLYAHLAAKW